MNRSKRTTRRVRRNEMIYSPAVEDYVKAIYILQQTNRLATTSALAGMLGNIAPASVTEMLRRLSEKGLVDYLKHHGASLTPEGERLARKVMRDHAVLETFLVHCLDYDADDARVEVEDMAHVVSERLVQGIERLVTQSNQGAGNGLKVARTVAR